ncbi:hypothetical protein [Salibacterium aidingense]|uniref:hypothetical protein n=1 Tax=Salibacterium aidingense TaxID=384933 RepID=UPI00042A2C7A|nr:hypothetical protein [Salibacterium aidingense]
MIETMVDTMLGPLQPLREWYAASQLWVNSLIVMAAIISMIKRRYSSDASQKKGESSS